VPPRIPTRTYEGATALLSLETPIGPMLAEVPASAPWRVGDAAAATLAAEALRVFAA